MSLFEKEWSLTVDNLDVSGLHIEFKVLRTIKREPNKAAIVVYNLSDDHRAQLLKRNRPDPDSSKLVGITTQLSAGYSGNSQLLLSADLREVSSTYESSSWKTTLAGDDGGRSYREGRINAQFAAGTPVSTVLRQCCDAMGVGLGNLSGYLPGASIDALGSTLPHGFTASGKAAAQLDRLIKSMGLTWSIQNGALQLLQKGTPLDAGAILLNANTGLIGSPESSIDASVSLGNPQQFAAGAKTKTVKAPKPKDPGIVKFKTLLIPSLTPGRKVVLQSKTISGNYMVTEVEYMGTSAGNDWNCNCVGRRY